MKVNSQEQTIVEKARLIEKLLTKRDKLELELAEVRSEIQMLPVRTAAPPPAESSEEDQPGVTPLFAGAGSAAR